jgi:hypothetical protein
MSHELVSRNEDIQRLVDKGYAVAFDDNHYLVVRDIPYLVGKARELLWAAIVAKFVDLGQDKIAQDDHQIYFSGSPPHGLDGNPIGNLGGGPASLALSAASNDITVQRSFSNKPTATGKFANFFDKIESYVNIISGPAIELHKVTPLTSRVVAGAKSESPFKFRDILTARAEIGDLASKFKDDVLAVIGMGGTGAYLLDFLVKTPVREIRGFDMDWFYVHNTFRSPGQLHPDEIGKTKAAVYQSRYDNFRTGLNVTAKFMDLSCANDLSGVTFAFVCVDKGSSRVGIFDLLISLGIPFIDVGMGLDRKRGPINGMLRVTYYPPERAREIRDKGLAELVDNVDDIYRTNIQIGELNALNACLAVIRYKQLRGFYLDEVNFYHFLFGICDLKILGDAEAHKD